MWRSLALIAALQVFGNANDPSLDKTAPTVSIAVPTSSSTFDAGTSSTVAVSGTSSDASGIAICRIANALTSVTANAATTGSGAWSLTVALSEGSNALTVTCMDPGGNQGTALITVTRTASSAPSSMPIGIPDPFSGWDAVAPDYATLCTNWPTAATTGCYYVDPGHASATNGSGNTNGYPNRPRLSIPTPLGPGTLLILATSNGAVYSTLHSGGGVITLSGNSSTFALGSAGPVWIRGIDDTTNRPTMCRPWHMNANYAYLENLFWDGDLCTPTAEQNFLGLASGTTATNVVFRHIEVAGDLAATGGGGAFQACSSINQQNLVFSDVIARDNGNVDGFRAAPSGDPDAGGLTFGRCHHVWVLDSQFFHNMGTGLQLNAGNVSGSTFFNDQLHHIYVGRNNFTQNLQGGLFSKESEDVVFSENTSCGNYDRATGSPGKGIGWQYGPTRLWIIYNTVCENTYGIFGTSNSGQGAGGSIYIVGNIIRDVANEGALDPMWTPNDSNDSCGIMMRDDRPSARYVINNTFDGNNSHLCIAQSDVPTYIVYNNIFTNRTEATGFDLNVESTNVHNLTTFTHCLVNGGASGFRFRVGTTNYTSLASYQALAGSNGDNCVTTAPSFVDVGNDDFRIQSGSGAENTGTTAPDAAVYTEFFTRYGLSIAVDLEGTVRPNGAWDIGAYEVP